MRSRYLLILFLLLASTIELYAQLNATQARHETDAQTSTTLTLSGNLAANYVCTGGCLTNWSMTVGGVPVTITAVGGAIGSNQVVVSFTPAVGIGQAVVINHTNDGIVNNIAGLVSQNNRAIICSDFSWAGTNILTPPCAPVDPITRMTFSVLRGARNSSAWATTVLRVRAFWIANGAVPFNDLVAYQSDLAGNAAANSYFITGDAASSAYIYPANDPVCGYTATYRILINGGPSTCSFTNPNQQVPYASHNNDDTGVGADVILQPSVVNSDLVCLGTNANMQFRDNTDLNCNPTVAPIPTNDAIRWVRVVYGSTDLGGGNTATSNIPNILVAGTPVTNATGNLLFPGGYIPATTPFGVPDAFGVVTVNAPVTTARGLLDLITTSSPTGQVVGQRFWVRLDYWNACNPYDGAGDALNLRRSVENEIEIVTKPVTPSANNKEYCFTEVFASGGTCGAPTGEFFELTAASVAGSTEIKWYNTLANANADASAIASTYGANCRFLRPENRTGGTGAMAAAGVYSVFARYRTGGGANCLSDPVQVDITRRSLLSAPGVISPLTSDVCNGTNNVPYSLSSAAPVVAFGGGTEYSWTFSGGAGATVDAPGTAQNITADFNIAGAFTTTTRSLDAVTQFTTNATTGGRCPVGTSSRTVTIYGATLGGTASGGANYCEGTDAADISLAGHRGSIVRWEVNFNAGGFVDAGVGTAASFDPGILPAGSYVYRAVVTNGPCVQQNSTTTTINIAVNPTLSDAGPDQALCGVLTAAMDASPAAPGVGTWTFISSVPARPAPVFSNINSRTSNVTITPGNEAAYTLRWTVTNPPCTSQDDVVIDFGSDPTNPNAGPAQDICGQTTTLAGNAITIGAGTWSVVSTPPGGTLTITSPNSPTSTVSLAGAIVFGTYQLRWRAVSGTCPEEDSFVDLTFRQPPTVTAPANFSRCVDSPPTAAFNIPVSGTFGGGASNAHWEVVPGFGTGTFVSGANDATNPVDDTYQPSAADYTAGTVRFRLVTDDPVGQCTSVNDVVIITIDRLPAAADAGPATMSVCGSTAALGATAVNLAITPGAVGTWTGPAGVTFTPDANTANATANNLAVGPNTLTWTITTATGVCGPSNDQIIVTRNATPANNPQPLAKCVDVPFGTTAVVTLVELQALNDAITGIAGSTNRTVQFFTDAARTIPYPASAPLTNGTIVYTIVTRTDVTPQCTTNGQVNITVAQRPLGIPQNPEFCEDMPVGSNTKAGINLTSFNNAVKDNVAANTVAWFSDAARTIAIGTPTSVTANNGTRFYARVTNPTTTCTDTTSLRVRLNPIPSPNPLLGPTDVCADPTAAILYQLTVSNPGYTYTWSVPEPPFDIRLGGTSTDDLILLSFPVIVDPGQDISVIETSDKGCVGQPNVKTINVDTSPPAITIVGPSAVCENEAGVFYEVANLANTTYSWTVPVGASIISGQGTFRISVNFGIIPGLVTVTPTTTSGCAGNPDDHAVAINPRPSLDALSNSVCSDAVAGITLSGTGATSFDITSVTVQAGLSPSSRATANGVPANAIFNDVFTNATGGPLVVQYTIVPVSALGCKGDSRVVNLVVQPEPVLDPGLADEICSSTEDVNIVLKVAIGSFPADQYEITSVIFPPTLTPVAGNPTNLGIFSSTVLTDDRWQNLTAGPLVVEYFVRPRNSGSGCVGDPAIPVRVTVNPEPQVAPASEIICSGDSPTLTLTTSPLIAGSTFTWTVKTITGLISGATNGTGATITDILVNNDVNPGSVTYEVRATGSAGVGACLGPPTDVTITVNPAPLTNNVDQIVCSTSPGGNTFTENLIALQPAINVDGSLTFTWHTSFADADAGINAMLPATASAFPLANGIPVFVRVDNGICARIQAVTYTVHPTPSFTAAITSNYNGAQLSCSTSSNGIITVTPPVNGTAPYLYSIDGGSSFFTSTTFNGLSAAGNPYVVRVRDARGCIADAPPLNFVAPLALTATTAITSNFNGQHIACRGDNNGEVTVARVPGTGTGAVTYSIQEVPGNVTGAASGIFTGLTAGTYTFVVRDVNNCQFTTASVTLIDPPVIVATAVLTTPVTCFGQADGVITVTASGGTLIGPTYTYTISPGGTSNTTGIFTGLAANTYTVNVEDDNGCIRTSNSISVTQPSALTAFASVTSNYNGAKISCPGANDAVITAIANGGNGGFTYVLVESPGNTTGNATGIYTGVGPGTYTVSVTDAQSCTVVTVPVNITEPTPLDASGVVSFAISCNLGSDGEIRISSTGGTGAYTFTMTSPAGPSNATGIFPGLTQGTYDFEVRDLNNCTDVVQVILGEPTAVTASAVVQTPYNGSQIICNGASDGIITVTASGGTGALTYVFDQFPANLTGATTGVFTGVPPGTGYTFSVRDAKNCTAPVTAPVDVMQPAVITATAAVTSDFNGEDISCPSATDGVITVTASGGTGALTYRLDQAPLNVTGAASGVFTGVGAGSYTVTVRDANSCFRITTPITVTPPPTVTASATVTSNYNGRQVSCNGASDGILTVTAGGGVTPYAYVLNEIPGNVTGATTGVFTGLPAGTYTVNVTDLNNCPMVTLPVTISEPTLVSGTSNVTSNYNGQQIRCVGSSDGIIRVTGSGGTAPYNFISIEVPGNVTGLTTGIFTGLPAGSYTFTVRDANNCTFVTPAVVISPPTPLTASALVTSNYHGSQISCFGALDGTITVTATGGTGALNYVFVEDPGNTTGSTSGVFIGIGAGGPYTFLVTDANTCNVATVGVSISEPVAIGATAAITSNFNGEHISCPTATDGVIEVTATGGTGIYTYRLDQSPLNTTGNATGIYSNVGAGTYTVTVRDENGCFIVTTSVTVVPPPPVTASAAVTSNYNGQQISCNGVSDGILTVTPGGGVGSYTYLLNQIPANVTGAATGVFTGLPAGTYTVNVRDANNCLVTTTPITITQPAVLGATAAVTSNYNGQQISCNGASDGRIAITVSGGTGPFAYASVEVPGNVTGAASGIFTGLPAGNYTFTVTDVNTCGTTTAQITISEPAQLAATLAVTSNYNGRHVSCNGASDGELTVTVTIPGTGASTFTIDQLPSNASGRFSGVFTGVPPGAYTVTVRDANNCSIVTNAVTVDPTPAILASAVVTKNVNCFAEANGIVTVTASGGTGSLEYLLIQDASNLTGQFSGVFTGLRAGTYTVRVTDINTCFVTTTPVTVTQPANLTITIAKMSPYNGFDLSCDGASDGEIRVTSTTGGAGPYTYALDGFPGNTTGATTGIFTGLSAGLYTITVTDSNTGDPFGACTKQSLPVFINNPIQLAVNLVGFSKSICIGADPTVITQISPPVGGIGIYTYQWQDSIVGGVFTDIPGAMSATFDPPAITQTTYYRRILSSGSCTPLVSDPITITVTPLPEISNVTAPQFLCENQAMIVFYDFAPGQAPFFFSYTQETIDQTGAVIATKVVTNEISGDSKPVIQSPFTEDVRVTVTGLRDFNGCVANPALFPAPVYVEVLKTSAVFTATAATQCSGSPFEVQWNANPEVQYVFTWPEGPNATFGPALNGPQSDSRILHSQNPTGIQTLPIILNASNILHLSNPAAPDCGVATHLENIRIFPTIIPNIVVPIDSVCSGTPISITNSTQGGTVHAWTVTDAGGAILPPPLTRTGPLHNTETFIIHNQTTTNPAQYDIAYHIENSAANGSCSRDTTVTVTVYREGIAKIGSPKDPLVAIPLWTAPSDDITFQNATLPLDAADFEYTWVFSNNNPSTPADTVVSAAASETYTFLNPGVGKRAILYVVNRDALVAGLPNGCATRDEFIFVINVPPLSALFIATPEASCLPAVIDVTNQSTGEFTSEWRVVNQTNNEVYYSQEFEPDFPITSPGRYTITLTIKNPFDAAAEESAPPKVVDVYANPVAAFITSPLEKVFVPDQEMRTDNGSASAFDPLTSTRFPIQYRWYFGDGSDSVMTDILNVAPKYGDVGHSPTHMYATEGSYQIALIAVNDHSNGAVCRDTAYQMIEARASGTSKVPNAFTPNPGGPSGGIVDEDGTTINDVFLPITKGVQEFQMQIFDRWGNLVFESLQQNKGWDGYDRKGNLMPAGVYVYKLVLRMADDQRTTQVGDVTLIR